MWLVSTNIIRLPIESTFDVIHRVSVRYTDRWNKWFAYLFGGITRTIYVPIDISSVVVSRPNVGDQITMWSHQTCFTKHVSCYMSNMFACPLRSLIIFLSATHTLLLTHMFYVFCINPFIPTIDDYSNVGTTTSLLQCDLVWRWLIDMLWVCR